MHRYAALFLLIATVPALQAQQPSITAQQNTVYVEAEGKYESDPDTALIQFNIAAQEDAAKDAYDKAARAAEQARQALRDNGIEPKAAEIGYYSLQPMYDWKSAKRTVVGYRVTTSVTLKLQDFSKIGPLVQQLAGIEATDNQSINYTLENFESAKQKAIQDAYRKAQASAETVAHAGERALGALLYASVDTQEQVRILAQPMAPMGAMRAMAAGQVAPTAEFSPQKISISANVHALFGLK
jgi:uncharacterized protein YggE